MNQTPPLAGIKVLDLTRVFAGPWSTQMLGDLGAEIIKIEHPVRGDEFRTYGPPFLMQDGKPTRESGYYLSANRNKKSVALDIASPEGQAALRELAAQADVMVENFKVGALRKHGLDYDSVRALNPGIVYCSITGFGQTGPWAHKGGLDSLIQALSGLMSLTGEADREPQKVGMIIDDFATGMYAAVAILAALRHREVNGGAGQRIDLSLLDCGLAMLAPRLQTYLISGEDPGRNGNASFGSAPAQTFACSDGVLMIQAGGDDQFRRLCQAIGWAGASDDPRFASRSQRVVHYDQLIPEIQRRMLTRGVAEWVAILEAAGVMHAPVNSVPEALRHEQVVARGAVTTIAHPIAGELPIVRNPIRFSGTPIERYTPPPLIGEHTAEVLARLGRGAAADGNPAD